MNHTPNPWTAQHDLRGSTNTGIITQGPYAWGVYGPKMRIANVIDAFTTPEEQEANARLIAAAPELLAMLKAANYAFYVKGTRKALQTALEGSRDLIRKAEGRE